MGSEIQALMDWLRDNNEAVTALAAIIASGIAVLSMLISIPIWLATRKQAILTRQTFQAGHTPYLIIRVDNPVDSKEKGVFSFRMTIDNHGPVLAHIVKWELQGWLVGHKLQMHPIDDQGTYVIGPSHLTLVPGQERVMQCRFFDQRFPDTNFPFDFKAMVAYRGAEDSFYVTDFKGTCQRGSWTWQECKMRRPEDIL